jgi:hypothetical protein
MANIVIRDADHYLDLLSAGKIAPEREATCPECGGRMRVRVQEVGEELRIWMNCAQCKAVNHADRGPKFAGWETLRS